MITFWVYFIAHLFSKSQIIKCFAPYFIVLFGNWNCINKWAFNIDRLFKFSVLFRLNIISCHANKMIKLIISTALVIFALLVVNISVEACTGDGGLVSTKYSKFEVNLIFSKDDESELHRFLELILVFLKNFSFHSTPGRLLCFIKNQCECFKIDFHWNKRI